jgi:hypothetical protein
LEWKCIDNKVRFKYYTFPKYLVKRL